MCRDETKAGKEREIGEGAHKILETVQQREIVKWRLCGVVKLVHLNF